MKNIIAAFILMTMLQNCNSQEKIDLKEIINSEKINILSNKDVEPTKEAQEIVTKLPAYTFFDQQIENFTFGNIVLENSENSYVKILVNSFSNPASRIFGIMIDEKDNPTLAEKLKKYLISQYGQPKTIEPEPTLKIDNIILGNSINKWIDSKNNATIYFYKNYLKSDGKQVIGFSLHIISNTAVYPTEISEVLQTVKIIDWYNTRF